MSLTTSAGLNTLKRLFEVHLQGDDLQKHLQMLDALAPDQQIGPQLYLGLERAPAGKRNHHDFEGGLVAHLLEMWETYEVLKGHFSQLEDGVHVTPARVLKGILYHDLHKAYQCFVLKSVQPWATEYGLNASELLAGKTAKTFLILSQHGIVLDEEQINAICWSEGGWAELKPRWHSVLSKLCYLLDEFSGNCLDRVRRKTMLDVSQ